MGGAGDWVGFGIFFRGDIRVLEFGGGRGCKYCEWI